MKLDKFWCLYVLKLATLLGVYCSVEGLQKPANYLLFPYWLEHLGIQTRHNLPSPVAFQCLSFPTAAFAQNKPSGSYFSLTLNKAS